MYVPDCGLLAKIDILMKEDQNNYLYYDCKVNKTLEFCIVKC